MEDPKLNAAISRRRFLEGIGTTAAGVTAVAAFGGRLGISAPFLPAGARTEVRAETLAPTPPSYFVSSAADYMAQQRGRVPLSSRGGRATTLH